MQLEAAKVLGRCRIRRAAEKGCKGSDVADIVVASLLAEIAHAHVFDHALAQWTDGLLAHRGAPVLRWRFLNPLILKTGHRPVTALGLPVHMHPLPLAPLFARSALPRKRVRSVARSGRSRLCDITADIEGRTDMSR